MKLLAGPNTLDLETPLKGTTFDPVVGFTVPQIIRVGVNLLLVGAAVTSFVFLLWGALHWITAGGDKEGLEKARKKITHALIGLAIVFSVYAIAALSEAVFGVNILKLCIPGIGGKLCP